MKYLLILRHAKALKSDPNLRDFDRPLNDIGFAQIPIIAKIILNEKILPDIFVSSSAKRTTQTAQLTADQIKYKGTILWRPELYETNAAGSLRILNGLSDELKTTLLVGHNPTQEEILNLLTEESKTLSTGALALIKLPIKSWKELSNDTKGKLLNLWQPKELM